MAILQLTSLTKHFGGVHAVDELDLAVEEGEIFGLIGPNGSGKSTTVNLICGVVSVTGGRVAFDDRDITGAAPHRVLAAGVARTFQNIRLFGDLTVWQNLWVAQNSVEDRRKENFAKRWFFGSGAARDAVDEQLAFAGLIDKRNEHAANLAFGEQRRLELARALATKPRLLLLDEPAAGMNLEEVHVLDGRLRALQQTGVTIVLVEHVMELVMGVTDRIAVLNFGRKIAEGLPAAIREDEAVQQAYLGSSVETAHA